MTPAAHLPGMCATECPSGDTPTSFSGSGVGPPAAGAKAVSCPLSLLLPLRRNEFIQHQWGIFRTTCHDEFKRHQVFGSFLLFSVKHCSAASAGSSQAPRGRVSAFSWGSTRSRVRPERDGAFSSLALLRGPLHAPAHLFLPFLPTLFVVAAVCLLVCV